VPRIAVNYQRAASHFRAALMRWRAVNVDPAAGHLSTDALNPCEIALEPQHTIVKRTIDSKEFTDWSWAISKQEARSLDLGLIQVEQLFRQQRTRVNTSRKFFSCR
jgi:hypothetical protein